MVFIALTSAYGLFFLPICFAVSSIYAFIFCDQHWDFTRYIKYSTYPFFLCLLTEEIPYPLFTPRIGQKGVREVPLCAF